MNIQGNAMQFWKMHGLGNDFVVVDLREGGDLPAPDLVRRIADRHCGVGFDQFAAILPGDERADVRLVFLNADGSRSGACGNATRCIARHLMAQTGATTLRLATDHAVLIAEDAGGGLTRVNMGPPSLQWDAIPLAHDVDTLSLPVEGAPVATGMGNPHATFFVPDAEAVDLPAFGAAMEHHPLYPERTNVEVVQILDRNTLRLRIWERGAGVTMASGSCSCAAAVAAARRDLTERRVRVILDGGELAIDWRDDGVWLEGPTATVFEGRLLPEWL